MHLSTLYNNKIKNIIIVCQASALQDKILFFVDK